MSMHTNIMLATPDIATVMLKIIFVTSNTTIYTTKTLTIKVV